MNHYSIHLPKVLRYGLGVTVCNEGGNEETIRFVYQASFGCLLAFISCTVSYAGVSRHAVGTEARFIPCSNPDLCIDSKVTRSTTIQSMQQSVQSRKWNPITVPDVSIVSATVLLRKILFSSIWNLIVHIAKSCNGFWGSGSMYKYLVEGLVYPRSASDPVGKACNVKASRFVRPACNFSDRSCWLHSGS